MTDIGDFLPLLGGVVQQHGSQLYDAAFERRISQEPDGKPPGVLLQKRR